MKRIVGVENVGIGDLGVKRGDIQGFSAKRKMNHDFLENLQERGWEWEADRYGKSSNDYR